MSSPSFKLFQQSSILFLISSSFSMTQTANLHKVLETFNTPHDSVGSSTTLSSPVDAKRQLAIFSTDTETYYVRPRDIGTDKIRPHRSRLPLVLYLLSFATPFRSSGQTPSCKSTWRDTLTHPYTLYVIGTLTAIPAGGAIPSMNVLLGYWTTRMTQKFATDDQLIGKGNQISWIQTAIWSRHSGHCFCVSPLL